MISRKKLVNHVHQANWHFETSKLKLHGSLKVEGGMNCWKVSLKFEMPTFSQPKWVIPPIPAWCLLVDFIPAVEADFRVDMKPKTQTDQRSGTWVSVRESLENYGKLPFSHDLPAVSSLKTWHYGCKIPHCTCGSQRGACGPGLCPISTIPVVS